MGRVVDRHGDAYFGGADHIDRSLVRLKYLEHLTQETCGQEHSAGLDLDGNDVVLGGHGFDLAVFGGIGDGGSLSFGVHRVQQPDRNSCVLGRLNACRMQNLGTEVGQLGGFLKLQLVNGLSLFDHSRVVVMHTVNVSPYLDFLSADGCTDKRCRIVGTATLQIVNFTVSIAADEALGDINLLTLVLGHDSREFLFDIDGVGFGILVCTHEIEGVKQYGLDSLFLHVVHHHVC